MIGGTRAGLSRGGAVRQIGPGSSRPPRVEFLVAADFTRMVAITPAFESVGVPALIVLIRTFPSFSLELEITGRWPWQKAPAGVGAGDAGPGQKVRVSELRAHNGDPKMERSLGAGRRGSSSLNQRSDLRGGADGILVLPNSGHRPAGFN